MQNTIKRVYSDFRGVDLSNETSIVNFQRSPDALNVWLNYFNQEGKCIESRPGYVELGNFGAKINGMHIYNNKAFIHAGTNLFSWNNFPDANVQKTLLKSDMNDQKSQFAIFKDKLYIVDGKHYLVYYDDNLKNVYDDDPYIPTTTIARKPAGGGEMYEDVNLLQPLRKNSFLGDGTSLEYYLDAQVIDEVTQIVVDNKMVANTEYEVNLALGKITFKTAPSKPALSNDNVVITFKKEIENYRDRISNCKLCLAFDNRIFFAGNSNYKNALFHCSLNNPAYISDLDYYEDGSTEAEIKSIVAGNNVLWVFKEENQQNETIFYHVPTTFSDYGQVYPSYKGNISTGCAVEAFNYRDDIVFLSKSGLEAVTGNINDRQLIQHRSSLIDSKLINQSDFEKASICEWNGYLLILINGLVFLGDIRQIWQNSQGENEYEWYLWDLGINNTSILKEYNKELYIGAENGSIFVLKGTNDNGKAIYAYWCTIMDNFGLENLYKTSNKRGGIAKIRTIPNGKIKIAERTNKTKEKFITSYSANGFDYSEFDYSNFSYTTTNNSNIIYKIKEKKFIELQLKFYTDELDKPFGIYSATIEAFPGGYIKK